MHSFNFTRKKHTLKQKLFEPLHRKLLETDCTGAFILLDTQVNPAVANADCSRSGLYFQRNILDATDTRILLYRGLSEIGKQHGAMPHRKWRLEFDTSMFPNYDELLLSASSKLSLAEAYRITDIVTLSDTSERVMLMTVPILGADGNIYGLCGFEVSESYFNI